MFSYVHLQMQMHVYERLKGKHVHGAVLIKTRTLQYFSFLVVEKIASLANTDINENVWSARLQ
jgi:hypothetical protein